MKRAWVVGSLLVSLGFFSLIFWHYLTRVVPITDVLPNEPWIGVLPNFFSVKGVGGITAQDCGKCHTAIYEEWSQSTHSQAYTDLQFQSELSKETSPQWLCLNCHIPVANQRESLVQGLINGNVLKPSLEPNLQFDKSFREEGVSCATCHLKKDESGNTVVIGANGYPNVPHPVEVNKSKLNDRCVDCHNSIYELNQKLVCAFGTGLEFEEYKKLHSQKDNCSSCHLPSVSRSIVKAELARPIRNAHKHGFVGGGVPKTFPLYAYQVPNGYKPGLSLSKFTIEDHQIRMDLQNTNAGHYVPSADPERYLLLRWEFRDRKGKSIDKWEERIGQLWEWEPRAKKIADNRFGIDETRVYRRDIPSGAWTVFFQIKHVRLADSVAKYMESQGDRALQRFQEPIKNLRKTYPLGTVVLEASCSLNTRSCQETPVADLFQKAQNARN